MIPNTIKMQKYVLWSSWNAILVHMMTKIPLQFFIESNLQGTIRSNLTMSYIMNCNFTFPNIKKSLTMILNTIKIQKICFVEFLECHFDPYHDNNTYIIF